MSDAEQLTNATARLGLDQPIEHDDGLETAASAPPVPVIVGNKKLTDITLPFFRAASRLSAGQLVKDEEFSLFESVGALEIMDPKMDSGFLEPHELLYDTYDVLQNLLPEEVIGIMDQLLCYEMAWHQGYPLSQTLFTSHYIENLLWPERKSLEETDFRNNSGKSVDSDKQHLLCVLRAYCVGLIKCCDCVIQTVVSSHYYEEEDFATHTYNRDLLSRHSTEEVFSVLLEGTAIISTLGRDEELEERFVEALHHRMSMRYRLLLEFNLAPLSDWTLNQAAAQRELESFLSNIRDTHSMGKLKPEAFSQKIQRKLTSTVPPRPVVDLSFEDAMAQLAQLCVESKFRARVFGAIEEGNPEALRAFLFTFSARKPEPLPYSRARVSGAFMGRSDDWFFELLRKDLELVVWPNNDILNPANWTVEQPLGSGDTLNRNFKLARLVDSFCTKAFSDFGGYLDYWRALGSNRCRFRRLLTHVLIGFDESQRIGDEIDREIESTVQDVDDVLPEALFHWAGHYKLRVSEWVIQLGFELEVYLPEELAGMYWLLATISRRRAAIITTMISYLEERVGQRSNSRNKTQIKHRRLQTQKSIDFLKSQHALARGNESLAEALYALYTYFHYIHLLPNTALAQPYNDPLLRYELRMKPFLTLQEQYMGLFEDYDQSLHPFGDYAKPNCDVCEKGRVEGVCDIADTGIRAARESFSRLKQMGASAAGASIVEKEWSTDVSACVASSVAAGLLVSDLRSQRSKKAESFEKIGVAFRLELPEPGKRYHDWWIVPKLAPLAAEA